MAPVAATIALSHVEGVSDSARARELYKYYQPNAPINQDTCFPDPSVSADDEEPRRDINIQSSVTSSKISSPDTALTAFCQLTTWRTGMQRAMISVIDAETQYFIAESTKSVDLVDNTKHNPGDEIWMGCTSVSKAGRLCERTIESKPTRIGDYPYFIVDDLSADERFNTLPFVTGSPFLKFYGGVPLITKRGIPIGSLFVVDDRLGRRLSQNEVHFMGTVAKTIMKHLEMTREVEEHRRGMKMSRGLASFVEGRAELVEADIEAEDGEGTKVAGQFETNPGVTRSKSKGSTRDSVASNIGSTSIIERQEKEYSAALSKTEESIMASHSYDDLSSRESRPDLESVSQPTSFGGMSGTGTSIGVSSPNDRTGLTPGEDMSDASSQRLLFSRASNLIREAFEVDGGVVFYDAQTGFSSEFNRKQSTANALVREDSLEDSAVDSQLSSDELQGSSESHLEEGESKPTRPPLSTRRYLPGEGTFSRTTGDSNKTVEILGFSTPEASSIHGDTSPGTHSFNPFEEKSLHALLRRYPRGKLWTFDSDGAVSSSSEDDTFKLLAKDPIQREKDMRRVRVRSARNKSDAKFLSQHFPGVRQLLFVPLWDAGRSRWLSGCFVWSTEPTRILSKQGELAFLSAFGNSVMAEWSRIDTEIADQKKGDFIGSISHELRSPLHGILASAEFLEEVTNGWEKQLVETIDSCGRTLLDTINHILDFSKINHFEKNWRRSKRAGSRSSQIHRTGPLALKQSDIPMLNLFQEVDISVVCEEVVESVFAGHVFQYVTAQTFDMVPDARGKMSDNRKLISTSEHMMGPQQLQHSGVDVILDVDPQNYQFITQPGALRRLIMNLLGNSLKYTSHGYVLIKLHAKEIDEHLTPGSAGIVEHIPRAEVTLTVTDTGKGISADFLRSKLFMPFAQENSLSSGTGLGLSIVRKIVSLLEGQITIDSEVGRGTQVKVTLPLLREMPRHTDSSTSTTKSIISLSRDVDQSINNLRMQIVGQRVSLTGFDIETKDPILRESGLLLKASIKNFLVSWYGLQVVPLGQKVNIIIANEANPSIITKLAQHAATNHKNHPAIIVLCSQSSRFAHAPDPKETKCHIGFVAKPAGPLKLAKAIIQCLDGDLPLATPGIDFLPGQKEQESNDLSSVFEGLSLSPRGGEVLDNTRMAADSDNARKAIESPTPNGGMEKSAEFPFPNPEEGNLLKVPKSKSAPPATMTEEMTLTASVIQNSTEKENTRPPPPQSNPKPNNNNKNNPRPKLQTPTLLLVDDNNINIQLLGTYLTRRGYETVHEAGNGLEAVNKVESREEGYDVIFMDITMPILDGFGATRRIRGIERHRRERGLPNSDSNAMPNSNSDAVDIGSEKRERGFEQKSGLGNENEREGKIEGQGKGGKEALIIAFTGRSSIEDQTEAVRCGIDLFMTKPVAFKEVGKIIDNWVANKEK